MTSLEAFSTPNSGFRLRGLGDALDPSPARRRGDVEGLGGVVTAGMRPLRSKPGDRAEVREAE